MSKKNIPPAEQPQAPEKKKKKKTSISLPASRSDNEKAAKSTATVTGGATKAGKAKGVGKSRSATKATGQSVKKPSVAISDEGLDEVLDEISEEEIPLEGIPTDTENTSAEKKSFSQRRREARQAQAEQDAPALERIRQKSGLSEDDVAMIFELGYENELGRLVGYENLKKLKYDHLRRTAQTDRKHYRTAFGFRGEEYEGAHQRESVLAAYTHDRKRLILRGLGTAALTLLLLFADIPSLVGAPLTDLAASMPLLFPLLGMLLLVACAALSWRQVYAGLHSLFRFTPSPYSVSASLLPITLIYDLLSLFTQTPMLRVNFLTACTLLVTVVCDCLRLSCELSTFRIISTDGTKTVLSAAEPRKKKLRRGDSIVKIISDDVGESLYRVNAAEQTVGFFRRFNTMDSAVRPFGTALILAFSTATLLAFANAVYTSSIAHALSAYMTVLLISLPCSTVFGYIYPLFRAGRLLAGKRCALIGNEAVEEYDCHKTVIFRDSDLFTAQKQTEVSIREDSDFRRDFQLCGILFRKLGGALEQIIAMPKNVREDPPVSIIRITENGVEAMVDNRYHLLAGNDEFLRRNGIAVAKESTDKALRRTPNVTLLYVAVDGVPKLSFEIEYNCKPDFERTVTDLAFNDTVVGLHSYDPNLNDAFVPLCRPRRNDPVRIIKPSRYDEGIPMEIVDAGAVALDEPHDIVYPIHAASGIGMVRRFSARMQLISALVGSLAAALLTVFGQGHLLNVFSILGYQAFWIAISLFASHSELNRNTLQFRK